MSDYEGGWDREWEPAKSQISSIPPATVPPEPRHNYIGPRGTSPSEVQRVAQTRTKTRKSSGIAIPRDYRPTLQSFRPGAPQRNAVYPTQPAPLVAKHIQARVLELPARQLFIQNEHSPDYKFEMMHTLGEVAKTLPNPLKLSLREVAADELAKICLRTGAFVTAAFIAQPPNDDHILSIWGTVDQVEMAKGSLRAWEMHYKGPGKSTGKGAHRLWTRMLALDGRKEHRLMRENLADHQQGIFDQHVDGSMMAFEAHLIWPKGYDLENFITDYEGDVLTSLRKQYQCKIDHQREDVHETRIACDNQTALFQVYNRLLGLMKEMVAKKRAGLRVVHCQFPSAADFLDRVGLKPCRMADQNVHMPELVGSPLPHGEIDYWSESTNRNNKKYRIATKHALQSCIKGMHVSQRHARMRVTFGNVALKHFQKPSNGQDTYILEDFIDMVGLPLVQVMRCPLAFGPSFDFINQIESLPEFGKPEFSWTVQFNFEGQHENTLQLEKEFSPNYLNNDEPDSRATRWLTFSKNGAHNVDQLLSVNHMDLNKVGYQIHLDAPRIYDNHKIGRALKSFENTISFKPPDVKDGIRFPPGMHASFPPLHDEDGGDRHRLNLHLVTEVTIARYPFKDTKGTFDVKRIDYFPQGKDKASPIPSLTVWNCSYYYQEWDTLMSELGNIQPGDDVTWNRDLTTFFPKVVDEDFPKLLPTGYKHFMKEVGAIQELLTKATKGLSTRETRTTNGVNGNGGH